MRALAGIAEARRLSVLMLVAALAAPARAATPDRADVVAIAVAGEPGAYRFRVTVRSPDAGCSRYASFWEVVRADGTLAYRRILKHSHVDEQPFAREGGPVPVAPDETVVVRAFLHPGGYGGALLRGTVRAGFKPWTGAPADFAADLTRAAPQPTVCRF